MILLNIANIDYAMFAIDCDLIAIDQNMHVCNTSKIWLFWIKPWLLFDQVIRLQMITYDQNMIKIDQNMIAIHKLIKYDQTI